LGNEFNLVGGLVGYAFMDIRPTVQHTGPAKQKRLSLGYFAEKIRIRAHHHCGISGKKGYH